MGGSGMTGGTSGAASGGMSGSAGSSGGVGGMSGASGKGGAGGSGGKANGSPGCGKSGRPADGKVYVANTSWLLFPPTYDGNTPMPVLFGFHGCGSSNFGDANRTEYSDQTKNNVLGTDYVVAIPLAASKDCFSYNTDITRTKALYDNLVANYCVDVDRVFATGHSSGAQFIVQILTGNHTMDAAHLKFKGVAPVAASDYGAITTPTPVMYIQGKNDTVRGGDGKAAVDRFVSGNQCSTTSMPYAGVNSCTSSGTQVMSGCVQYSNCMEPTIWCSHNDPAYSNTSHGIPCFAAQAMDMFFKSLP
jgi:poly(3-hydroxybutyrate) depolymerase